MNTKNAQTDVSERFFVVLEFITLNSSNTRVKRGGSRNWLTRQFPQI